MIKTELKFLACSLICVALATSSGCGKNSGTPTPGGMATQGEPPPPTEKYEGIDLDQLTSDLRRWIVATKQRPASFEEFASKSKVTIPPAPAGKKFALSKDMRVVLVNR